MKSLYVLAYLAGASSVLADAPPSYVVSIAAYDDKVAITAKGADDEPVSPLVYTSEASGDNGDEAEIDLVFPSSSNLRGSHGDTPKFPTDDKENDEHAPVEAHADEPFVDYVLPPDDDEDTKPKLESVHESEIDDHRRESGGKAPSLDEGKVDSSNVVETEGAESNSEDSVQAIKVDAISASKIRAFVPLKVDQVTTDDAQVTTDASSPENDQSESKDSKEVSSNGTVSQSSDAVDTASKDGSKTSDAQEKAEPPISNPEENNEIKASVDSTAPTKDDNPKADEGNASPLSAEGGLATPLAAKNNVQPKSNEPATGDDGQKTDEEKAISPATSNEESDPNVANDGKDVTPVADVEKAAPSVPSDEKATSSTANSDNATAPTKDAKAVSSVASDEKAPPSEAASEEAAIPTANEQAAAPATKEETAVAPPIAADKVASPADDVEDAPSATKDEQAAASATKDEHEVTPTIANDKVTSPVNDGGATGNDNKVIPPTNDGKAAPSATNDEQGPASATKDEKAVALPVANDENSAAPATDDKVAQPAPDDVKVASPAANDAKPVTPTVDDEKDASPATNDGNAANLPATHEDSAPIPPATNDEKAFTPQVDDEKAAPSATNEEKVAAPPAADNGKPVLGSNEEKAAGPPAVTDDEATAPSATVSVPGDDKSAPPASTVTSATISEVKTASSADADDGKAAPSATSDATNDDKVASPATNDEQATPSVVSDENSSPLTAADDNAPPSTDNGPAVSAPVNDDGHPAPPAADDGNVVTPTAGEGQVASPSTSTNAEATSVNAPSGTDKQTTDDEKAAPPANNDGQVPPSAADPNVQASSKDSASGNEDKKTNAGDEKAPENENPATENASGTENSGSESKLGDSGVAYLEESLNGEFVKSTDPRNQPQNPSLVYGSKVNRPLANSEASFRSGSAGGSTINKPPNGGNTPYAIPPNNFAAPPNYNFNPSNKNVNPSNNAAGPAANYANGPINRANPPNIPGNPSSGINSATSYNLAKPPLNTGFPSSNNSPNPFNNYGKPPTPANKGSDKNGYKAAFADEENSYTMQNQGLPSPPKPYSARSVNVNSNPSNKNVNPQSNNFKPTNNHQNAPTNYAPPNNNYGSPPNNHAVPPKNYAYPSGNNGKPPSNNANPSIGYGSPSSSNYGASPNNLAKSPYNNAYPSPNNYQGPPNNNLRGGPPLGGQANKYGFKAIFVEDQRLNSVKYQKQPSYSRDESYDGESVDYYGYNSNDDSDDSPSSYRQPPKSSNGRGNYGTKPSYAKSNTNYGNFDDTYSAPSYGKDSSYGKKQTYGGSNYGNSYDNSDDSGDDVYNYKPSYGNFRADRTYDNYGSKSNSGYDKYGRPSYGNPTHAPPVYEAYTSHYKADVSVPFPYTAFADPKDTTLKIPKLGDYHCFLTGAPWTTCGRKSLTTYFLDQCLVLYFTLSANVDGICGGEPPKPTPKPDVYNDYYYSSDYNRRETYAPSTRKPTPQPEAGYGATTAAPSPTPSSYEITPDYLKEKCLQSSYVSITTATVMCLTENYIRINFIEHYAASACNNPVEGPILYLKKLHAFIHAVKECTGDAASNNYPNLYRTFEVEGKVAYNPNAPYYLDSAKKVTTQQYTSGEASGLAAFTLGDSFMCANTEQLLGNVYTSSPGSPHYSPEFYTGDSQCPLTSSAAKTALAEVDRSKLLRYCKSSQYTTDRTYRGLYDAVHYIDRKSSALHRPQSIAEIAVRSAGILEQPILEGFGIVYYCAFHACRANNDGDLSKCYPEFKSEDDWNPSGISYSELKKLSDDANDCITDGYLDSDDITSCTEVEAYNNLLSKRSYVCLAEGEIVDFLGKIYAGWAGEEDAISLVYGRHLADEKCYGETPPVGFGETFPLEAPPKRCPSNSEIYGALTTALNTLLDKCNDAKTTKTQHSHYGGYGRPQYGDPQYGTEAKYGRRPTKNNYATNDNYPSNDYGNDASYGGIDIDSDNYSGDGYDKDNYAEGGNNVGSYGSYYKDVKPSSYKQYSASRV
ncbi:hypothetical protein AC1031_019725 [Aphanomyces cochlioides]|nr:hypothetical protein AC1031_019725 [Aphanomyces cochlioides]